MLTSCGQIKQRKSVRILHLLYFLCLYIQIVDFEPYHKISSWHFYKTKNKLSILLSWASPSIFYRYLPHLPLTENRLKFFVPSNPTNNYENIYIWWHEIIKINLVSQALFEKTHFSVILYYKIDHFCPLKINFHTFPAIWPNVWVWNSLLPSFYHLLVQLRHARSLFFPLDTNDCAKIKPRCKKYAVCFGNHGSF